MIFVSDIQAAVAHEYGIAPDMMREPWGRTGASEWKNAHPRQVAMLLTARLTEHSLFKIGRLFGGRDHSTVILACRAVEKRRRSDPRLHNALRRLTLQLVRH